MQSNRRWTCYNDVSALIQYSASVLQIQNGKVCSWCETNLSKYRNCIKYAGVEYQNLWMVMAAGLWDGQLKEYLKFK